MQFEEKSDEPEKLSKSYKDNVIQVSASNSINISVHKVNYEISNQSQWLNI